MLEIVLVIVLCKALGKMLRAKGVKPIYLQILLVVLWIFGEFAGGFVGGVVHVLRFGAEAPMGFAPYLFAVAGAAMAASFTFLIAYLLPAQNLAAGQATLSQLPVDRHRDPNNPYAP